MGAVTAVSQMTILFIGILIGFIAVKLKIIGETGTKAITALVMNIILPLMIVSSGITSNHETSSLTMLEYFGISLACYAIAFALGLVLSRFSIIPKGDKRLCAFMTTFANNGFMGLPIVGALFGADAVLYATVFNLPFNFLVFSIGIILVSDDAKVKHINPKMFVNPCLVASIVAIALYLTSASFPPIVMDCLDLFGGATVPLAMIITGASLAKETPKDIFLSPALYAISAIKLVVVPAIAYLLLSAVFDNPTLVQVGTVLMAMPVAANATMLCVQYGGDDRFASRGIFLSTLLSLVSVPAIMMLLSM